MSSINGRYEHVLYLVMSATCNHCVKLKENYLGKIRSAIDSLGNVKFVPIELSSMSEKIPSQYPSTLSVYVKWFPTFVLVSTAELNKSNGSGIPFKASVFNGDYVDNKLSYRNEYAMNDTGIVDWIQKECNKTGIRRNLNENESFISGSICTRKFKPRSNV